MLLIIGEYFLYIYFKIRWTFGLLYLNKMRLLLNKVRDFEPF